MARARPARFFIPPGDLAGQLLQVVEQADHLGVAVDDLGDLPLGLVGVLPEREGDVVVEVERAEQGAVLEEHAELPADPVDVLLLHARRSARRRSRSRPDRA